MKRGVLITALLLSICASAQSRGPHWELGAQWGIHSSIFYWNRMGYITEDNYYVRSVNQSWDLYANGLALLSGAVEIGQHARVGLYLGYQGLTHGVRVFPAGLEAAWHFQPLDANGWFLGLGGAAGIAEGFYLPLSWSADIGGGYRFYLGNRLYLDLGASYRISIPQAEAIYDKANDMLVERSQMRYSSLYVNGLTLTMALRFRL